MSTEVAEKIIQELSNMNTVLIVIAVFLGLICFFKNMHGK